LALVTSNSQGELSPLERGIHHRSSSMGVREYARLTGRSHVSVLQESKAAEVVSQLTTSLAHLEAKTQHLSAIHALPEPCWQVLKKCEVDYAIPARARGATKRIG